MCQHKRLPSPSEAVMSNEDEHQRNVYQTRNKGHQSKDLSFTLKKNVIGNHVVTTTKCKTKSNINYEFACCSKRLANQEAEKHRSQETKSCGRCKH